MYGRKNLETYYKTSCVKDTDIFYGKDAADKVMDAMEVRIKELEEQCTRYQTELMNRDPALNTDISKMETTTTKWISANDRLPEEQIDVLFIEEDGCVHIGEMWKAKNEVYWFGRGEPCYNYVTHWMPIPTPPTTREK